MADANKKLVYNYENGKVRIGDKVYTLNDKNEKGDYIMKILVVGLGLIGGSLCKALKKYTYHTVIGSDINKDIEILVDYEKRETITLEKLIPQWWGTERYEQK